MLQDWSIDEREARSMTTTDLVQVKPKLKVLLLSRPYGT